MASDGNCSQVPGQKTPEARRDTNLCSCFSEHPEVNRHVGAARSVQRAADLEFAHTVDVLTVLIRTKCSFGR